MTGIPIAPVNLGNGQVVQGGGAPDFWNTVLQSLLQGSKQGADAYTATADRQQRASASSAQLDIQKQEMAFRIAQEKTKQEGIKHQQEVAKQQGEATKLFLETALPHMAQTGAINQLLPQPQQQGQPFNPQGPAGQPLPAIQQTPGGGITPPPAPQSADIRLTQYLANMDPAAAAQFVQEQLPHLLKLREAGMVGEKGQAVQTGDTVTTYVPGKGFWDSQANGGKGGYVPQIDRKMSADEKQAAADNRELRRLSIMEARDAAQDRQAQRLSRQFDARTKDVRDRSRIIEQTLVTLDDAAHAPDPAQRRVLYSSAIANFVQAADQKAQLRIQMLNYFKDNIDPSLKGKLTIVAQRLAKGTYPDYVYEGLIAHIKSLKALSQGEYDKHRAGEIKRHPILENYLPASDEFFTPNAATGTPAAADPATFFGGVPPRAP